MWDYYVAIEVEATKKAKTYDNCLSKARKETDKERRKQQEEECRKKLREGVPNDPASTLVGRLLDEATLWWLLELPNKEKKEDAPKYLYMAQAQEVSLHEAGKIAENLDFRANFNELPSAH